MSLKALSPAEYAEQFRAGSLKGSTDGLLGRLIRGKTPADFETLSDDPSRLLILMTDSDGLALLPGMSGFNILKSIGWDEPYATQKVLDGFEMKLVVCREGGNALLATWENVVTLVGTAYPAIADRLKQHLPALKSTPFADFERDYGHDMSVVDHDGPTNPAYMTYDRFVAAPDTTVNARAFLYFAIHLRELYAGDGFTYDNAGAQGVKEYMALNCKVSELQDPKVIDLTVELPIVSTFRAFGISHNHLPSFYNPNKVDKWYHPNLEAAMAEGRKLGLQPQSKRSERNMLIMIDEQWDFTEKGRLPVTGMFADVRRVCDRIVTGVLSGFYTDFMLTFDCHPPLVIHGSGWWRDEDDNAPDVTLPVMMKLVDPTTAAFEATFISGAPSKIYYPRFDRKGAVEYAQHLEATKQNGGNIWVFTAHCNVGTDGISLVPALAEVIYWAAAALKVEPICVWKGMIADRDWFGPFRPCMDKPQHPQGGVQTVYLDMISQVKKGDVVGEAKDFCVEAGTRQVMEYYGNQPDVLKNIRFINDCTSPIVAGSPAIAQFEADMLAKGITLINHDQW
jgi:nicotinamidase-related amidase